MAAGMPCAAAPSGLDAREAGHEREIFLALRHRHDLRQQQRASAGSLQEGFLQRARGAPGRQQEGDVRQFDRGARLAARNGQDRPRGWL